MQNGRGATFSWPTLYNLACVGFDNDLVTLIQDVSEIKLSSVCE